MAKFNTGNPLGSSNPRDLYDNAEGLDQAVNSKKSAWLDRLGYLRPTLQSAIDPTGILQLATNQAELASAAANSSFAEAEIYKDKDEGIASVGDGGEFLVIDSGQMVRYKRVSAFRADELFRVKIGGTEASLSDDWNAINVSGDYYSPNNYLDFPGRPPQLSRDFILIVRHVEVTLGGRATQTCTVPRGGESIMLLRTRSGSTWGDWERVITGRVTRDDIKARSVSADKLEGGLLDYNLAQMAREMGGDELSFTNGLTTTFSGSTVNYSTSDIHSFGTSKWFGGNDDSNIKINGAPIKSKDGTALVSLSLYLDDQSTGGGQVLQSVQVGGARIDFSIDYVGLKNEFGYGSFYIGNKHYAFRYKNNSSLIMTIMVNSGLIHAFANGSLVLSIQGGALPAARVDLLRGVAGDKRVGAYVESLVIINKGVTTSTLKKVIAEQASRAGADLKLEQYVGIPTASLKASYSAISSNGECIATSGSGDERSPASLSKVALLMIAVNYLENSDILTVTTRDIRLDTLLDDGDEVSFYDACLAAMIASSNTAANTIARYVGDKIDGGGAASCVREMNILMKSIGAGSTNFVNASGIYNQEQVTNSSDMAKLGSIAMSNNKIVSLMSKSGTSEIKVNGANKILTSTVENIGEQGVFAGKTGTITSPTVGTSAVMNFVSNKSGSYCLVVFDDKGGLGRFSLAGSVISGINARLQLFWGG